MNVLMNLLWVSVTTNSSKEAFTVGLTITGPVA